MNKTCEGLCYLCLRPVPAPSVQARCPDWDDCIKAQKQLEADAWYEAEVARLKDLAPA